MAALTEELLAHLNIKTGLNGLEKDVELLDQFMTHANGCGMESLDNASGKLIELGLAERYPSHFKVGSGLEGISNLLTNLKTAVSKMKGAFKGKKPEQIVDKPTSDAIKALDQQYTSKFWGNAESTNSISTQAPMLAKLVKGGSFVDVKAQVETYLGACEATLKDGVVKVLQYWAAIKPQFEALRAAKTEEERQALLNQIVDYCENTDVGTIHLDELPQKQTGGLFSTLSPEEAEAAIEFSKALLQRSKDIYKLTDAVWDVGVTDDDADGWFDDVENPRDGSVKYLRDAMATSAIVDDVDYYTEAMRHYMFEIIKGLEEWVGKSIK